jgi:hypothetical protein
MKHVVLTRSAYGPGWDLEANARRLAFARAVTIPSMAAQTDRDWTWLVALDRSDPLKAERREAFASAGVTVKFLEVASPPDRSLAAVEAYRANWNRLIGSRREPVAMTRLDDDDALAPWMIERLRAVAPRQTDRTALIFPFGVRIWKGCYTLVRHESNAMHTLVAPAGDTAHVYDYKHREVRKHALVKGGGRDIAWVWARHPDTLSGWHSADPHPISDTLRGMFPTIDWSIFGKPDPKGARGPGGRFFR